MRILLFETSSSGAQALFEESLRELAEGSVCEYTFVDEANFERSKGLSARLVRRLTRSRGVYYRRLNEQFLRHAVEFGPDIILVCKGRNLSPHTLATVKRATGAMLVNFAADDPFNPHASSEEIIESIPLYDLYACTKRAIIDDVHSAGCARVVFVPFAYKPSIHFPDVPVTEDEIKRFSTDIMFVGGCDEDRVPYFRFLLKALPQIRLGLYGGYWSRWQEFRPYAKGIVLGRDFRLAIGGSRIAINLVRRANRDGHTMRSFEIPAIGGFMLAERTAEHLEFWTEGFEAAYFESPEEMVTKVVYYLEHVEERKTIAENAARAVRHGHTYMDRLLQILSYVETCHQSRPQGNQS